MTTIPFVIDNQQHKMADVLNTLVQQHNGHSLDIATAYFNVGGWHLLHKGLEELGNFRLLLGDEPEAGFDLGLREVGAKPVKGLIRDLASASFNEQTLRLVEDLIAFLHQEHVQVRLYTQGFLHAKCYLFYSGGGFERFNPVAAIVGSSNFTRAGLLSNKELNLAHRANLLPEEVSPERVKGLLESSERKLLAQVGEKERMTAANVPGVLAAVIRSFSPTCANSLRSLLSSKPLTRSGLTSSGKRLARCARLSSLFDSRPARVKLEEPTMAATGLKRSKPPPL